MVAEPFSVAQCRLLVVDASGVWRNMAHGLARAAQALPEPIPIQVPALVHAEHWYQERRRYGLGFDERRIRRAMGQLQDLGVRFCPYSIDDAESHGNLLHVVFPTDREWAAVRGGHGASTVDWFIASHAAAQGAWIVTEDGGAEFGWYPRRVGYEIVLRDLAAAAG